MAVFNAPIHATDAAYERAVLKAPLPVVAVFWRRDCPPCEALDPLLNRLARELAGRLLVVKLNVEDAPQAARRKGVNSVPTILLVKNGAVLHRGEGAPPEATLRDWVAYLLGERSVRPAVSLQEPAIPLTAAGASRPTRPRPQEEPARSTRPAGPVTVTDATFDEFVRSGVALVDFWADWCGPCHMIAPAVEMLAHEYAGRVKVGKLNVDRNPRTPARFNVQGIPTLIIFRDGRPVDRIVGVHSLPALRRRLEAVLAGERHF